MLWGVGSSSYRLSLNLWRVHILLSLYAASTANANSHWRHLGMFSQEDFLIEHALLEKLIFLKNLFCEQIFHFSTGKNQTDRSPGCSPGRFLPASLSEGRKQIWQALAGQTVRALCLLQAEPVSLTCWLEGWERRNPECCCFLLEGCCQSTITASREQYRGEPFRVGGDKLSFCSSSGGMEYFCFVMFFWKCFLCIFISFFS